MRRLTTIFLIFTALVLNTGMLQAQPGGNVDERARELVSLAKKYYRTNQFLDAALTFELATQRPINDLTTFSWYMAGMSYFGLEEFEKAEETFNKLLRNYPRTTYADDVRYHKSLILMKSDRVSEKERGLEQLFTLMRQSMDPGFKDDVESAIRSTLINDFEQDFLERNMIFADQEHKPWFMEAIAGQMDAKGDGYVLLERLSKYIEDGGLLTDYLADLRQKYESGKRMNPKRLNVALFLSFNLQLMDTARNVPSKSLRALELFEGMRMALDSLGGSVNKEINFAVFDTQSDTIGLGASLDSLERFNPDIIVGDIRTSLATEISLWAEAHRVIHIIPRNPLNELIKDKHYTFLIHPSLNRHGQEMARYLASQKGKRSMLVFNDNSYFSSRFAKSFIETLKEEFPTVSVTEKIVPNQYKALRDNLKSYMRGVASAGYDAVYIPLSSEEAAGLIISQLKFYRAEVDVVGGPDWEMFTVIDPELKSNYNLEYSTFYFEKNDSSALNALNQQCLEEYGYRPSKYTVQGYDIMGYILEAARNMNAFTDPVEVLRQMPVYRGIHEDIYLGDGQDNQKINVVRFRNGRIDKVNRDLPERDTVPGSLQGNPGGR
jgi:ABC-type branched-subunit amino acid transport system substrate-binding protein